MENDTAIGNPLFFADNIEDILKNFPENPVSENIGKQWQYMTDTYSKFQIATWGSLLVHEVLIYYTLQYNLLVVKINSILNF